MTNAFGRTFGAVRTKKKNRLCNSFHFSPKKTKAIGNLAKNSSLANHRIVISFSRERIIYTIYNKMPAAKTLQLLFHTSQYCSTYTHECFRIDKINYAPPQIVSWPDEWTVTTIFRYVLAAAFYHEFLDLSRARTSEDKPILFLLSRTRIKWLIEIYTTIYHTPNVCVHLGFCSTRTYLFIHELYTSKIRATVFSVLIRRIRRRPSTHSEVVKFRTMFFYIITLFFFPFLRWVTSMSSKYAVYARLSVICTHEVRHSVTFS